MRVKTWPVELSADEILTLRQALGDSQDVRRRDATQEEERLDQKLSFAWHHLKGLPQPS